MAKIPRIIRRRWPTSGLPTPNFAKVRCYFVPKRLLDPALAWLQANAGPGNCAGQQNWWLSASGVNARDDGGGYADFAKTNHADAFASWLAMNGEQALTSDQKNGFAPLPDTKPH